MSERLPKPDVLDSANGKGLWDDSTFESAFAAAVGKLNRILGTKYSTVGAPVATSALAIEIEKIISYHARHERFARDWEASRIGFLGMDLEILYKHRKQLFARYKNRLKTATENEYPGIRFEIAMAVNLMISGFPFTSPDPPDFRVESSAGSVDLECTTTSVSALRDRPLAYKLEASMRAKAAKPYVSRSTVLVLDYTNLLFTAAASKVELTHSQALAVARREIGRLPFGAIILFAAVQNVPRRRYEYLWDDVLSHEAAPDVQEIVRVLVEPRPPMEFQAGFAKGL